MRFFKFNTLKNNSKNEGYPKLYFLLSIRENYTSTGKYWRALQQFGAIRRRPFPKVSSRIFSYINTDCIEVKLRLCPSTGRYIY